LEQTGGLPRPIWHGAKAVAEKYFHARRYLLLARGYSSCEQYAFCETLTRSVRHISDRFDLHAAVMGMSYYSAAKADCDMAYPPAGISEKY
jgi:hypothetical protein